MIIEKSPFYKNKNLNNTVVLDSKKTSENNELIDIKSSENSSFWSWFKGLVNPLQNLPLISGIYSSVNSEDESSDRDMVQNSLGGFLYGGPIGAIAGFGNWVFNKLFDKTPTEFALDLAGISKIWKGKNEDNIKIANENMKTLDGVSPLLVSRNIVSTESKSIIASKNIKKDEPKDKILGFNKGDKEPLVAKGTIPSIKNNQAVNIKENVDKDILLVNRDLSEKPSKQTDLSNEKLQDLQDVNEYKKIEFNYPTWKPNNDKFEVKKDLIQSKYKNYYLDKINNKSELKIDA